VLVAQSRVMTEQGGNILMWSSNGNLDAGKGAKTSVSPPPLYSCDIDWICAADIKGAVSGAGIATLQSQPGVPVGDADGAGSEPRRADHGIQRCRGDTAGDGAGAAEQQRPAVDHYRRSAGIRRRRWDAARATAGGEPQEG
jgi:hypothetical protein